MTWLAWRQFRVPAALSAAALAVALAVLAFTGPRLADSFTAELAACASGQELSGGTLTCGELQRRFLASYPQVRFLGAALVALPALVGAFWGAPLVARELEAGTHRLVWVQSVTRTRWLAVKLALVGGAAVVLVTALSLAYTWWAGPLDRMGSRLDPGAFPQRGVVPVAYAAFAAAAGVLAGAVVRRTVPAMAAAVGAFVAARLATQAWLRPRLLGTAELSYPTYTFFGDEPAARLTADNGWVMATRTVDGSGRVVSAGGTLRDEAAAELCGLGNVLPTKEQLDACGQRLGLRDVVSYLPADRFWALQAAEAAVFALAAVALVGLCFWWVRRRVA